MIIGIGTDLVDIARVADVLKRHGDRFVNRVFATEEREDADHAEGLPAHYAKRWAAKEAAAKALGLGIDQGVYLRDIVVVRGPNGAPTLDLRGGAAEALQKRCRPGEGRDPDQARDSGLRRNDNIRVHVSLSDDAGLALAFVVIETV